MGVTASDRVIEVLTSEAGTWSGLPRASERCLRACGWNTSMAMPATSCCRCEAHNKAVGGHEPCGVVVELGSAVSEREARVGQRVIDYHYGGCGVCRHCMAGWRQMCVEGAVVFGSVAHGDPRRGAEKTLDASSSSVARAQAVRATRAWGPVVMSAKVER